MTDEQETKNSKCVLITGASTGIGRATAELLAQKGYSVYAGARKEEDIKSLSAIPNIYPLKLDVIKEDEIEKAYSEIRSKNTGLFAIINNAGIDILGPTVDFNSEAFKWQLDVNLIGVHRIISKFFPLIKESNGRIINISSGAGRSAVPFTALYSASKFGLEGYSDGLRRELMLISKKIKVVIIEPGVVKTPIWKKDYLKDVEKSLFHEAYTKWQKINVSPFEEGKKYLLPIDVAKKIHKALVKKRPKLRYLVTERNFIIRLMLSVPERWKDFGLRMAVKFQKV